MSLSYEHELGPGGVVLTENMTFMTGRSTDSDIFPLNPSKEIAIPIRFIGDGHKEIQMYRINGSNKLEPNGIVYQALPV